jgi:gamma-butyrobetaine dioxygenase|tara:strand:- start:373 stop:537 length:165 start_codon:yes stop_codon:yes gene_type:complete
MNVEEIKIKNVKKNQSSLNVEWSDGEKSSFNFLWLRDNCPTSVHPYARHRIFNL